MHVHVAQGVVFVLRMNYYGKQMTTDRQTDKPITLPLPMRTG